MSIAVGDKLTGKVTGITKFGAFVDINEPENGLVHISEVANDYVKDVHDYVNVGDEVSVVVTNIGADGKIALSMKQAQPKPETPKPRPERRAKPMRQHNHQKHGTDDFDAMMSSFLKDSEDRLSSLKRNTEAKRGGRGGRRGR